MNIFLDKASRDVYVGVRVKKSRRWRELSPTGKPRGKPWSLLRFHSSQVEKTLQQCPLGPSPALSPRLPPPWAEQGFPNASPLPLAAPSRAARAATGREHGSARGLMAGPRGVVTLVTSTWL